MLEALLIALYVQIPVVIGGVLHMWVVTHDYWPALRVPLNQRLFGANKTWRGVLAVPLLTTLGALCLLPLERQLGERAVFGSALLLAGAWAGLGYVLAELPNSWIKRRLGIAPGNLPRRGAAWCVLFDQLDSALGVALAYALFPGLPWMVCLFYVLTFPITALLVKRLLFIARLKRSAV
jgi:hypothetical protein